MNKIKTSSFKKSIQLNQGFKKLLSESRRSIVKNLYRNSLYLIHFNPSNSQLVEKEINKEIGVDLFCHKDEKYNQYLSDESYILEVIQYNHSHQYSNIAKFSRKISVKTGKIPILIYSLDYQQALDSSNYIDDHIRHLQKIISSFENVYHKKPTLVFSFVNLDSHPCYKHFISCVKKYNLPLLTQCSKVDYQKDAHGLVDREQYLKNFSDNVLLTKQPKLYLKFNSFVNDIFDMFKIINQKYWAAKNLKQYDNINYYISHGTSEINQSLFQQDINIDKYRKSLIKKLSYTFFTICFIALGLVFVNNIMQYHVHGKQFKHSLSKLQRSDLKTANLTQVYQETYYKINNDLYFNWLYPNGLLSQSLKNETANYVLDNILLPKLKSDKNPIEKAFLLMTLYSSKSRDLRHLILENSKDWSKTLGISTSLLKVYIESKIDVTVPSLNSTYVQKTLAEKPNLSSNKYKLVQTYITNNSIINLKTLNDFFTKIYLPVRQQYYINIFMQNIYPDIKSSVSGNNASFFKYFQTKNQINEQTMHDINSIRNITNLINAEKITNYNDLLHILTLTNTELSKIRSLKTPEGKLWYKAVLQATLNTLLNRLSLEKKYTLFNEELINQSTINIADSGAYDGNIPVIYTLTGINRVILPEVKTYHQLLNILNQAGISSIKYTDYYHQALDTYVNSYIKAYVKMLSSYKHIINPSDIKTSLMLIASKDSEFNNMLNMLAENTAIPKSLIKELPELELISSSFKNINKFINDSKNIDLYQKIIFNISNKINNADNKQLGIEKITYQLLVDNENSSLYQLKKLLDKYQISPKNQIIFLAPLIELINIEKPYIKQKKLKIWNADILSLLSKNMEYFPFNKNGKKSISVKEMNKIFSPSGKFWSIINKDMYGIFVKKNGKWVTSIPGLFGAKESNMLFILNSVQSFTNSLWTNSNQIKPIVFEISIEKNENQQLKNHHFIEMSILNIGDSQILGLSVKQHPIFIKYDWSQNVKSSVGFIDDKQKVYTVNSTDGDWSALKLLKAADATHQIYTWNNKEIKVLIQFKISFDNIFSDLRNNLNK